ncbi:MAG: hypothetical protein OEY51_01105 [Cyclobacteriaceae bacterium]|nr:hypothetical protein [Cyclobacteriaceae bacterium]
MINRSASYALGRKAGWCILLTFVMSCSKTIDPGLIPPGYEYMPLEKGNYRIYQVDQTLYSTLSVEQSKYYVKDSILDVELNGDGSVTWTINRFQRKTPDEGWSPEMAWSIRLTDHQAISLFNNNTLVVLAFPLYSHQQWDGNAMNTRPAEIYEVTAFNEPFTNEHGLYFSSTATVLQQNNQDFIVELDQRSERYALGVGLVEKIDINFVYCQQVSCLGLQQVESGHDIRYSLIDYGH